jgi:hypothetical protein
MAAFYNLRKFVGQSIYNNLLAGVVAGRHFLTVVELVGFDVILRGCGEGGEIHAPITGKMNGARVCREDLIGGVAI